MTLIGWRTYDLYYRDLTNNVETSSASCALVLTFSPLQPRRKSSLPGGSAAKVFEPRSQNQINPAKAGRVLRRPSGRLDFREFGDVGVAFFWFLFLARQEKELAAGLPPANGQRSCEGPDYSQQPFDRLRANGVEGEALRPFPQGIHRWVPAAARRPFAGSARTVLRTSLRPNSPAPSAPQSNTPARNPPPSPPASPAPRHPRQTPLPS